MGDADPLRLAAARERHRFGVEDGNSCERARTLDVLVIEAARHPDAGRDIQTLGAVLQFDQSVRIGIRQRFEHDAFDHGENRDVRGNGEAQRAGSGEREGRGAHQTPRRKRDLLGERFDRREAPDASSLTAPARAFVDQCHSSL